MTGKIPAYNRRFLERVETVENKITLSKYMRTDGKFNKVVVLIATDKDHTGESLISQIPKHFDTVEISKHGYAKDLGTRLNHTLLENRLFKDNDVVLFLGPDAKVDQQVFDLAEIVKPVHTYKLAGILDFENIEKLKQEISEGDAHKHSKRLNEFVNASINLVAFPEYGISKEGYAFGSIIPTEYLSPFVVGQMGTLAEVNSPRKIAAFIGQDVEIDDDYMKQEEDLARYISYIKTNRGFSKAYGWFKGNSRVNANPTLVTQYEDTKKEFDLLKHELNTSLK
ncbi:MAG: hypothetical protein GOU98_04965 [Candidatus Altiarchaeota archaeon]|nr:hypothetical protein [Candidatus Altiarchaeota archaeon]